MISMRIASYNIRKAIGLDRKRDPMRIARVLRDVNGKRAPKAVLDQVFFSCSMIVSMTSGSHCSPMRN